METHELEAHTAYPPLEVTSVAARIVSRDENWLRLRWRIEGTGKLVVPPFAGKGRADELWRTTCFELFLKPEGGEAYCEFNLSPSERWAAYDFSTQRDGMENRPVPREPECTMRQGSSFAVFDAAIPAAALPQQDCAAGLTCVLEEEGGIKSFWALCHPGDQPDFHDPACFTARLAAPTTA
ncbi:DOMON-like domain-containing protein [Qipengyuania aurantiaca]|uniref:DOMON-like domain-containing protein n=1 Tax=Qipengyuania aurantiaca TaxID=2867233 RepID=A0ABX8ZPF4_9SPHN|nr:DOMON-like domain-containing protein [Qipengyuania aurantiaca]QZD89533.1 DOMON-like domain-containing protein [Qipengyuania aurantiaca]